MEEEEEEEEEEKRNPEPEMEEEEEEEEEEKKNPEPGMVIEERNPEPEMVVEEEKRSPEPEMVVEEEKKKRKKRKERNPEPGMEEEEEKRSPEPEMVVEEEEKRNPEPGMVAEEEKKKRKERNPEPGMEVEEEKKKKKKEIVKEEIDVKMEVVPPCSDKISPLVGYFTSGFDPQKATDPLDIKVYRCTEWRKTHRLQLVVSPRNSNIDFVGTSYTGEAASSQTCSYALGVLDKETRCLKIVPIACNKIFRLEPRVAGLESYEEALVKVKEEALTGAVVGADTAVSKVDYLTKRARKRAEKQDKIKRKEDATVEKNMETKIKNIVVNKKALEITAALAVLNIPPHDSTATIPQQAYPLDKIILQSEWHCLQDVLKCVLSEKELPSNVYPNFVCNRAHTLLEIKDEMERDKLAVIFSFINHLIKFKDQRSYETRDFVKNHRVPDILFQRFNTMFTDPGRLESSAEKKDLLISYVLVLSLYADSFKTDPFDIAKDLRISKITLRQHFLSLGCKLSREDKREVMTLTVPLEFPKPSSEKRRRR